MAIILGMSKQGPKHQIFVTAEAKANDAAAVKFAKVKPCGFTKRIFRWMIIIDDPVFPD
jgi:hypothetical protein